MAPRIKIILVSKTRVPFEFVITIPFDLLKLQAKVLRSVGEIHLVIFCNHMELCNTSLTAGIVEGGHIFLGLQYKKLINKFFDSLITL